MVCIGNYRYQEQAKNIEGYYYNEEIYNLAIEFEKLGGRLIIQVHDELIAEAPKENIFKAAKILEKIMIQSAASVIKVPMKCDVEILDKWSGNKIKEII